MTRIYAFFALRLQSAGSDRRTRAAGAGGSAVPSGASDLAATVILAWLLAIRAAPVTGAEAGDVLVGPVPAVVEEVIDGDTLRVRAHIWLGQDVAIHVRLAGVDAPETRGGCARERELAERAQDFLTSRLVPTGDKLPRVRLREVRYGKYARRVVARVETTAGLDLSAALLAAGLARPYDGGRRPIWCD
jgi:micrococcal nuclease